MPSKVEQLSTEIFFEIFDYLTPFEIVYAFTNINRRFNGIVGSYPLYLDFQNLSRAKFDWLCRYLRPKQVIALSLSDECIPNQCALFKRYFPRFQSDFSRLKAIRFNNTSTILSHLPSSVSSIDIQSYLRGTETDDCIVELFRHQAPFLTSLKVDGSYIFRLLTMSLTQLIQLTIGYSTIMEFERIIPLLPTSLTHLKIFLDPEPPFPNLDFQHLATTLTHLTLTFSNSMIMSFEKIEQCLKPLVNMAYLVIQAVGSLDLLDGSLWEQFLSGTSIKIFHFRLTSATPWRSHDDQTVLLQPFRSSFWSKQNEWCVVCEKGQFNASRPILYSLPYFQSPMVFYPSKRYLSIPTAEQEILDQYSMHLIITYYRTVSIPSRPFLHVHSLTLLTSTLPSLDLLQSISNLKEVRYLDLSLIDHVVADDLQLLIEPMWSLKHVQMRFDPLFLPPLRIHSFNIVSRDDQRFVIDTHNVDRFCYLFFHVEYLEISVRSPPMIISLLNRLHYLELIRISCYEDSLIDLGYHWFIRHVPRLIQLHFSYRITPNHLTLSIGDRRTVHSTMPDEQIEPRNKTTTCYDCRLRCLPQ